MTGAGGRRVAILGFGAIGRVLAERLRDLPGAAPAIVLRDTAGDALIAEAGRFGRVLRGAAALADHAPEIVVECAGHAALSAHGAGVLRSGARLIVASCGALADPDLETGLRAAARQGGGRLEIVPGALAGLDALAAIPRDRLHEVVYEGVKPAAAWRGTPAEDLLDLERLDGEETFASGTAREIAARFPKNANVVAAVALAGPGFEATRAALTASGTATGNTHRLRASGPFGSLAIEISAEPLASNPKTSAMTPESLFRAVRNQVGSLVM